MPVYQEKEFRSVSSNDLGLESEKEKEETKKQQEQNKDLFGAIKEALGERVTEVRLSGRLKNAACCLTAKGPVSLEMERVLGAMPGEQKVKAERVLELNPDHEIFPILQKFIPNTKKIWQIMPSFYMGRLAFAKVCFRKILPLSLLQCAV